MKILSPFGPKLGKIKIPSKIISLLNKEVDKIIKSKLKIKNKMIIQKKLLVKFIRKLRFQKNLLIKI